MIKHNSPISGVAAYSKEYVATAGYDNQVILWDAISKKAISKGAHDHLANHCAFSPCGAFLASAGSDHTARLWSLPELKLCAVMSDHKDDVEMVAFHPFQKLIATASRDKRVRVFDFQGRLVHCFRGHQADVLSVAWTASGKEIVSSSDDGTVRKWSIKTQNEVQVIDLDGAQTDTLVVCANDAILAGNDNGQIVSAVRGRTRVMQAHQAGVKRLVFDAERNLLVSVSYDRSVRIWSVVNPEFPVLLSESTLPASVWPRACAFRGDTEIVFGSFDSSYVTYNFQQDIWSADPRTSIATIGVNAVAVFEGARYQVGDSGIVFKDSAFHVNLGSLCNFLTPVQNMLLTGGQLGIVFDAVSGAALYQHRSPLNCAVSFEFGGRTFAVVGSYTGEGLVFRVETGKMPDLVMKAQLHENAIKGISYSDGCLFSVCADGKIALHEFTPAAVSLIRRDAHEKIANGCCALPAGKFASVSRDLSLRIWSRTQSRTFYSPHSHSIKCVAACALGRFVATGSYNGTVAILDLKTGVWTLHRPTCSGISSLYFDKSESQFLASSYDGNVYEIKSTIKE